MPKYPNADLKKHSETSCIMSSENEMKCSCYYRRHNNFVKKRGNTYHQLEESDIRLNTRIMRVSACQAAKTAGSITVVRWPPQPGNAGYRLLYPAYPPPLCLNPLGMKPFRCFYSRRRPQLAGFPGCTARYAVPARHYGE